MTIRLLTYALKTQTDVVGARQRARQVADLLGFNERDQTRIATSVSEVARNAIRYAEVGKLELEIEGDDAPQVLVARVSDKGPGMEQVDAVLDGTYRSTTGMGIGLIGSRRLMDHWELRSVPGKGTEVTLGKLLPEGAPVVTKAVAGKLAAQLAAMPEPTSLSEAQSQNAELLATLADLQDKQAKLLEMARELEDTNRGVVALYAELDEKAAHLRNADEMKSRFLSNMSHEFRTPLNSIRALCGMLLARADGPLVSEQEVQVRFVSKAAEDLSELVNDLLDLAKIEAGKIEVRPALFEVHELFSALRGMLRPLLVSESVELVFEDATALPPMITDESKVSQILRNFISNALKFTERGTVRVRAELAPGGGSVVFSVQDSGIGIAPEDHEIVFEEFTQVANPLQRKVKGTGLGLPLCRKLASLLGGEVSVASVPGEGSTFFARIPVHHATHVPEVVVPSPAAQPEPAGAMVLIVEDDQATRVLYEKYLKGSPYYARCVSTLAGAREIMKSARPEAVMLDIMLGGEEQQSWRWLAEVKAQDPTLPVLVASVTREEGKALTLGADAFLQKPVGREALAAALERVAPRSAERIALIIDDDAAARYVIRHSVKRRLRFEEASDGESGLALARSVQPGVIFLDLAMPGMQGEEVLERLQADPATASIPVIVVTSSDVDTALRDRLAGRARAIVHKRELSVEALGRALEGLDLRGGAQ